MLTEAHIPLDEMCIGKFNKAEQIRHYKLVILPDNKYISDDHIRMLDEFAGNGGTVLAVCEAAQFTEKYEPRGRIPIKSLGIDEILCHRKDMLSAMFLVSEGDKKYFPHFKDTAYIAIGHELIYAKPDVGVKPYLTLIPPQSFGPPERCYAENHSDLPALTVNSFGKGRGIYIPWKPGTFFYKEGYTNTAWFMRDLIEEICGIKSVAPSLSPMVEVTLSSRADRLVVQLVNASGHFGNSYFAPLPVYDINLRIPTETNITGARALRGGENLRLKQVENYVELNLSCLKEYEAVVLETSTQSNS